MSSPSLPTSVGSDEEDRMRADQYTERLFHSFFECYAISHVTLFLDNAMQRSHVEEIVTDKEKNEIHTRG
jgi:hypothetical protein